MAERASIYHGFNAETDIRLFRVRTSFLHRSKIRLEFGVTNLSTAGPYIAISYEWGSDQIRSRIERDDGFQIGLIESAAEIIHYVPGKRRRKEWVWMDAICIDQKNETEKRHQIALMGKIYSSASQVLACIGPHLRGGDEALKFVPKVYNILTEDEHSGYKPTWTISRRLVNLDPGMLRWAALWSLLRSSFFERMWITQEMVMAPCTSPSLEEDKGLMITCRKEDLAFMIIAIVAQKLGKLGIWLQETIPGDDKFVPRTLICVQNMGGFRQMRLDGQAIPLSNALRACVYYKAKYGVDKIYAVMNCVQDPLNDDLRSDITELFSSEADSICRAGAVEDPVLTSREEDAISTRLRERKDSERWTREVSIIWKLFALSLDYRAFWWAFTRSPLTQTIFRKFAYLHLLLRFS